MCHQLVPIQLPLGHQVEGQPCHSSLRPPVRASASPHLILLQKLLVLAFVFLLLMEILKHMSAIPEPCRWKQEDQKFRVILSHRESLRLAWATGDLS